MGSLAVYLSSHHFCNYNVESTASISDELQTYSLKEFKQRVQKSPTYQSIQSDIKQLSQKPGSHEAVGIISEEEKKTHRIVTGNEELCGMDIRLRNKLLDLLINKIFRRY